MDADKLNADADWMEMDGWRTRALAAERTVREQRRVIEAARRFARCVYLESHGAPCNERSGYCTGCRFAQTLAALAPDTEESSL